MREPRTVVEWLPITLAPTAVSGKIMGFLLMWSGSSLSAPLLYFIFLDMIPMQVADTVRKSSSIREGAPHPVKEPRLRRHSAADRAAVVRGRRAAALVDLPARARAGDGSALSLTRPTGAL
jgi:hypothetical protein